MRILPGRLTGSTPGSAATPPIPGSVTGHVLDPGTVPGLALPGRFRPVPTLRPTLRAEGRLSHEWFRYGSLSSRLGRKSLTD
jgi:hypothetical protein